MLELLSLPFMQRAIISGIMVAVLLGYLGSFVTVRNLAFLGDGIAHASLAGIALAILVGWLPTPTALIFAALLAVIIFYVEKTSRLSADTIIGMIFSTGMALGILLLHFTPGFQPELISFLFGNILSIQSSDVWLTLIVGSVILATTIAIRKQLLFTLVDEEGAYLHGINTQRYILLLYVLTALGIVLSIKLVGIILVSALLLTPSATAQLVTRTFSKFQLTSVILAIAIVFAGLATSVALDIPSGASIVLVGSGVFVLVFLLSRGTRN